MEISNKLIICQSMVAKISDLGYEYRLCLIFGSLWFAPNLPSGGLQLTGLPEIGRKRHFVDF